MNSNKPCTEQCQNTSWQHSAKSTPTDAAMLSIVLTKIHRFATKLLRTTESFRNDPHLASSEPSDQAALAAYCDTLLTASTSLNRLLYQYDRATGIDPVDLVAGKKGLLSAKLPPEERHAIYSSIQIRKAPSCVAIYLPFLPGRKQIERQFINELLFQRLLDEGPYPHWNRVHVLFTHVYPQSLARMPKDVDNFNYKPTIDYLAAALRFSDAAPSCSLEMRSEFRDDLTAGAYIQVSPQSWESTLAAYWDSPPLLTTDKQPD